MSVEVVIPVGPGDPRRDAPIPSFLERALKSLRNQSMRVTATCAVDENLPKEKLRIIEQYADKVVMFPAHSYFRPGGIWNKIYTCWEQSDADFVAWNGYDDYSGPKRFELQQKTIVMANSHACFCANTQIVNGKRKVINDGNIDFFRFIGGHAPFMGAFLIRKDYILNCGMADYRDRWVEYFEGFLYAYIMKGGYPCYNRTATFYLQSHPATITETGQEQNNWVQEARDITKYSQPQCHADWLSCNFEKLCEDVRVLRS